MEDGSMLQDLSDGELAIILEHLEPLTLLEVRPVSRSISTATGECEDVLWSSHLRNNAWPPRYPARCGGPESGLDASIWQGVLRPKEEFRMCSYLVRRELPTLSDALRSAADHDHGDVLTILLKARADPNESADSGAHGVGFIQVGAYPLHLAAKRSRLTVLERLLNAKADVDAADQNGRTGLMLASASGQSAAVRWLLERGASIDVMNDFGQTALHCAALLPRPEIVGLLLLGAASANCVDRQGQTPLHMALTALPRRAKREEMPVDPSGYGDEYCYEKNTSHGYSHHEDGIRDLDVRKTAEALLSHGGNVASKDYLQRSPSDVLESKCRPDLRVWLETLAERLSSPIIPQSSAALATPEPQSAEPPPVSASELVVAQAQAGTSAQVKSTGRVGQVLLHDPSDQDLTYKLHFNDGAHPEIDWFSASAVQICSFSVFGA